jgi:hypothetical protein
MKQDGVKVLTCQSKLLETKIIALDNINSVNDNLQDKAFDNILKKSLETKGMLNPILVCTDKDFKQTDIRQFERRPVPDNISETYRCLIGNNRYKYAKENGYTHIECHIVKTFDEVKAAHRKTQIEPRRM